MQQQTAVEWLIEQLKNGVKYNPLEIDGYTNAQNRLFEQAKEMEKQQIIDAATWGALTESGERYYNDKYGSKGSDETLKNYHIVDTNEMVSS